MSIEKVTYIIEGKDNLSPAVGKATKSVGGLTKVMSTIAPALGVATIVAGIGAVVSVSAKFEKSMSTVKALTGATGEEFKALQDQAKALGKSTEFSASQSADAMGFLAQAGFNTSQIMDALPSTLSLASAGSLDLARTADIASNVLSGYGLEAKQMGKVSDVLAKTFSSSNVDLSMLGETFKQVGPVASGLGFQFNEVSSAIGILGNAGIQGSLSGTALKNSLVQLSTPTKAMSSVFNRLGIQTRDSEGKLNSLTNIIGQLEKSGASGKDVMQAFGKIAGPSMLALLKSGSKGLADFNNKLNNAGGTAKDIAETKIANFSGQITILMSTLEGVAISIGDLILPALTSLVKGVVSTIGVIGRNIDVIGALAVAFGILAVALSWTTIVTGLLAVKVALLNFVMALNPITLIVVGIGLLIAGLVIAYRESETFRQVLSGLWEVIKAVGSVIWDWLIAPFKFLFDLIKPFFPIIKEFFVSMWQKIKDVGKAILDFILKPFRAIKEAISGFLAKFDFFKDSGAKGIVDKVSGAFKRGFEKGADDIEVKDVKSKDTKLTTSAIGGTGGAGALAGGKATGNVGADIKGAQGTKLTNLTININKLIDTFEIKTTNLQESSVKVKEEVARALLTAVNDVNIIAG